MTVRTSHTAYMWVRAEHLNARGFLSGGRLLTWVDDEAAIFAHLLAGVGATLLTRRIGEVEFLAPAREGEQLSYTLTMSRMGTTSILMDATVDRLSDAERIAHVRGILFVNIDGEGRPLAISSSAPVG